MRLTGGTLGAYEAFRDSGFTAMRCGDYDGASHNFEVAEGIAAGVGDDLARLHVMSPGAKALWSDGKYSDAQEKLADAYKIGEGHGWVDEQGIALSNIGRARAHCYAKNAAPDEFEESLRFDALSYFKGAYGLLKNHPHFYYRYANAQHGSVVAALAGDRLFAADLIIDGLVVAPQTSQYDKKPTCSINPKGLVQIGAAAMLMSLGNKTPLFAGIARQKLIG